WGVPSTALGGGMLDPSSSAWVPLPPGPEDAQLAGPFAGVFGEDEGGYESPSGWALDVREGSWGEIPERPGGMSLSSGSVATVGNRLVVVGGEVWDEERPNGELLNEVWMWTPPPD
ncbi:MAG TPA: hypothetical protein VIY72_17845, partial [Acidimicrobiales bacterium]